MLVKTAHACNKDKDRWFGLIQSYALRHQVTTNLQIIFRTREPEIVNIDDQEKLVLRVPKGTVPIGNSLKADTGEVSFAMCFPVAPGIGMSVQCQIQRADGTYHTTVDPCLGPF